MRCLKQLTIIVLSGSLAACALGYQNDSTSQRPEIANGMGGRIIYPGQGGVGMPGVAGGPSGSTSASSNGQPGTSSGSSSGSGSGSPAGNTAMISGSSGSIEGDSKLKQFPAPGALLGYPFWIFGKTIHEKADESQADRENPRTEAAPESGVYSPTPDDAERARIVRENERLKDELVNRARERNPARREPGMNSIEAELAALQASLERRRSGEASSPPLPAGHPSTRAPLNAPDTADRNRDGQADLWSHRRNGRVVREVIDDDYDGRPDRNVFYGPDGSISRSEEDLNGDGSLETVTIYKDGQPARRRSDSDADGQSDAWSFYEAGELVRNETDRDGDGFRDLILTYEGGKLVREEEDRNGDGRPDVISTYLDGDLAEKHEDLDFDGSADVESFYKNGKLVRRNLNSDMKFEKGKEAPRS
ncbi:MAG: hypothetical protein GY725_14100 [bacterium]|nr:hypothetical protein [bacterium]